MYFKRLVERYSRPKYAVATKVAIYKHDASAVLVMHYPQNKRNGLPGGHMEMGEQPDAAVIREVEEELGVVISAPVPRSFIKHADQRDRLILTYTYIAPDGFTAKPTDPKYEYDTWLTPDELAVVPNMSDEYRHFILKHWPASS